MTEIEELKSVLPSIPSIVNMAIESGNSLKAPCPFCRDDNGGDDRFYYKTDEKRFYCRKCMPKGGDVIDFHKLFYGKELPALYKQYGIGNGSLPPPFPSTSKNKKTPPGKNNTFYSPQQRWTDIRKSTQNPDPVYELFDARKISRDVTKKALAEDMLCFKKKHRLGEGELFRSVACAFRTLGGNKTVVGVQFLTVSQQPYKDDGNNKIFAYTGGRQVLNKDGFFQLGQNIESTKMIILCEGVYDVASCVECMPEVCGLGLGSSTYTKKIKLLKEYFKKDVQVICFFDNDSSGEDVNQEARQSLGEGVRAVKWPEGTPVKHDVNDLLMAGKHQQVIDMIKNAEFVEMDDSYVSVENRPDLEILDALNSNEDGDASLYQSLHRDKLVYDHLQSEWYSFQDHYWQKDIEGCSTAKIQIVIDCYKKEAQKQFLLKKQSEKKQEKDQAKYHNKIQKLLFGRIKALQTVRRKSAVLNLASKLNSKPLSITGIEWDTDPWLLGCPNGVLNLKTGTFRPGEPEDYIKTITQTEFLGIDETCPRWERFLLEIFDGNFELIDYIQRLFGYGITGLNTMHICPVLWGEEGRNGKGTLLETLKNVLGTLAYKTEAEMFLMQKFTSGGGGAPNTGILQLRGKRIVWASEIDEGQKLNVGRIKELVGGDTLSGRPLYGKEHIEFEPSHLLMLITNHKPKIPANDNAMWERVSLIPFTVSFVENPEKPNQYKADHNLIKDLKAEKSGILAWLVQGCLAWQKEGLHKPDMVKTAIAKYQYDEDQLTHFIEERCVQGATMTERAGLLYTAYQSWCKQQGYRSGTGQRFWGELDKRFDSHVSNGKHYERIELQR